MSVSLYENIKHLEQNTALQKLLPQGRNEWIVYILCACVFAGFCTYRPVISIGVIGLIVFGILGFDIKATLRKYSQSPAFYINLTFLLVILLSGIDSDNKTLWLTFVQIKLPFLFLPLAFCAFDFFDRAFFNKMLFAFASIMAVSATGVMINYILHYDEINQMVSYGGIIPTPFSHIRYTLLLVFAFFCFIWLWEEGVIQRRWILLIPAFFIFVVIHILSSRSGWLALYIGLVIYFISYMVRRKKYITGLSMIFVLAISPVLFYYTVPSFQRKINYMKWTAGEYHAGRLDNMSDAMRIASWKTGIEIIRENPYTGVGAGDLLEESKRVSHVLFPNMQNEDDRKMPHNEFIWIWAATGIVGFIAYCIAFLLPFLSFMRKQNWLFAILFVLFLSAFMTEAPLEEQIGSTFYLLFLLIFLTHFTHATAAND